MTSSEKVCISFQRPGCIAIGQTGEICKINNSYIVKYPKSFPGETAYNELRLTFITVERHIYERLGPHEGILPYHGLYDDSGAIKLAYARQGDLETYIPAHRMPSESFRAAWIRSLVNAFCHIYSCKVLHQDVKLDNILIDNNSSLKIADFANGAIFPLDADMETICAEDPLSRVDILGIGCVMYSIATWTVYSYDYFEKECWPRPEEVPTTDGVMYGKIIDKCWRNEYSTIQSLYEDFQRLDNEQSASKQLPRVDFVL
ncbi:CAMK/CAMKL protein kinase [Polytolypa hystricis UAMH7299]|uniref:CAMK/CAMKL protein kinase n=1 Tax=Polytolypa hystricis (strain UAMH7299) TaxID=1447883 RepID=A0A2B7Y783_POLH7|nr:CAMK/CAMKL protein kinase [Polytolypa hystricis UAMH7299]